MTAAAGIAGVILAGGRSSRMGGGDKCLERIGGEPVLAHVIRRLKPQVEALALNANGDLSRFREFGLPVIADATDDFRGPLAGILAGLDWAARAESSSHLLTVAADTPFLPEDLVQRLAASLDGGKIAVAASAGCSHPVFALWSIALRDDLAAFMSEKSSLKVSDFAARHSPAWVDFPVGAFGGRTFDPFFNVNTPDDLALARRIAAENAI